MTHGQRNITTVNKLADFHTKVYQCVVVVGTSLFATAFNLESMEKSK